MEPCVTSYTKQVVMGKLQRNAAFRLSQNIPASAEPQNSVLYYGKTFMCERGKDQTVAGQAWHRKTIKQGFLLAKHFSHLKERLDIISVSYHFLGKWKVISSHPREKLKVI